MLSPGPDLYFSTLEMNSVMDIAHGITLSSKHEAAQEGVIREEERGSEQREKGEERNVKKIFTSSFLSPDLFIVDPFLLRSQSPEDTATLRVTSRLETMKYSRFYLVLRPLFVSHLLWWFH